jgi:4-amino-4-deoxy-L-arabinose transferase-like glycosyltransferase
VRKDRFLKNTIYHADTIFYGFLALHILIWTLLPTFVRFSVSHDVIEAFVWGQSLDWGYDKNPWFAGWVARMGMLLGANQSAIGYYFMQQIFIGLGFWSAWQLAKTFFNELYALVAVLILEGCFYFSAYVETNNDNFILIGLWTFAIYQFYLACHDQRLRYWFFTAIALALALMTKYSTAILLLTMFCYLVSNPAARCSFYKPGFYLALLTGIVMCLPNLLWLAEHQWISVAYLLNRKAMDLAPGFYTQHWAYPLGYVKRIAIDFLLSVILFITVMQYHPFIRVNFNLNTTDRVFLWCLGLGPFLMVFVVGILFGWQLYWEWGVPYTTLFGLLLVDVIRPTVTRVSLTRFIACVSMIMLLTSTAYIVFNTRIHPGGSGDYPAEKLAADITQLWHERYHTPLKYVAGSRYTAGYIGFYSKDKPKVFAEWNPIYSPGVTEDEINKYGAIFLQDGYYGISVLNLPQGYRGNNQFPTSILKKYPRLILLPVEHYAWMRNNNDEPIKILIGILPPL